MDATSVFAIVRQAAGSIDYCERLIESALANHEAGFGWQYSSSVLPHGKSKLEHLLGAVEYAPARFETSEQKLTQAVAMQAAAREELKLFELISLVGSDLEKGERGVANALFDLAHKARQERTPLRVTRKRWVVHPTCERVTWKSGSDFRTACPYIFVRLDGQEVINLWPRAGAGRDWLD